MNCMISSHEALRTDLVRQKECTRWAEFTFLDLYVQVIGIYNYVILYDYSHTNKGNVFC